MMKKLNDDAETTSVESARQAARNRWPSLDAFDAQLRQIYKLYRDALLSQLYYATKLKKVEQLNMISEIGLALGTGSFGSLAIWQGATGKHIFVYLAATSAALSILKPILQWPKQISRYSQLVTGFQSLYFDLQEIAQDIETKEDLSVEQMKKFTQSRERFSKLSLTEDSSLSNRLVTSCREEVLKKIPVESLWVLKRDRGETQ